MENEHIHSAGRVAYIKTSQGKKIINFCPVCGDILGKDMNKLSDADKKWFDGAKERKEKLIAEGKI